MRYARARIDEPPPGPAMSLTHSPLRYPGGKSGLLSLVDELLRLNDLRQAHYAEPYAGGGSLALSLLFGDYVSEVYLNDIDPGIAAFWRVALNRSDELIARIRSTRVSIAEWRRQREVQENVGEADALDLAFSTFFLNRTNRSGIIKHAGVIGGLRQDGNYKIGCRFNKPELIRRIRRIAKYRDRIHFTRFDAMTFWQRIERNLEGDVFCCVDPPYYRQGAKLYTSFYSPDDHSLVAEHLLESGLPWMLTYDAVDPIRALYRTRRQYELSINYSAQTKRVATELLIVSKRLRVPNAVRERQVHPRAYGSTG